MSQPGEGVDLPVSVGYRLKEASSALRAAMEEVLRPLGMNVTHYACLELLAQRPGLSNSDLARGTFVTRQTMNVLLQALERDGAVERPGRPPAGKVLPATITDRGRAALAEASAAVRAVEERMLSGLDDADRAEALRLLGAMIASLRPTATPASPGTRN
ncbi:DNA-binding MarR family transcriptional regulator [Microbacterium sp. AG790]|uniref:MarR family winged helix-turn-helix transcriptional regulator n=1 Tax=Microbacterium sp. AG790 TaxID=2183995 RepID=UPI000EB23382|nr:MarR family transcriptional regulator [Microbacterium sp. AG790]RKS90252.1 DNA-binding MarR family transcriptional regulator [Microbacterium sp. AG790]